MEQHTETVEELKKTIEELQEDLDHAVKQNRIFCEANNLGYQVRRSLGELGDDAWNWKWVIVLIAVELWRLHLDVQHWTDISSCLEGIALDLSNLLDAVDPHGPRG